MPKPRQGSIETSLAVLGSKIMTSLRQEPVPADIEALTKELQQVLEKKPLVTPNPQQIPFPAPMGTGITRPDREQTTS